MRADRFELPLCIIVQDPVPGLAMALQRGGGATAVELVGLAEGTGSDLPFEFEVDVQGSLPDGRPRLLGAFVQGPPRQRFVYLCVGEYAGQADADWAGRVKVPLGGITWPLIEGLTSGGRIEGRIPGQGPKGGPALATVPILAPGWICRSSQAAEFRN
jgi:hypothetical protein